MVDLENTHHVKERAIFPFMHKFPVPTAEYIEAVEVLEDEHSTAGILIKEIHIERNPGHLVSI
jgi:hemerythrin-like domain-containing protein